MYNAVPPRDLEKGRSNEGKTGRQKRNRKMVSSKQNDTNLNDRTEKRNLTTQEKKKSRKDAKGKRKRRRPQNGNETEYEEAPKP